VKPDATVLLENLAAKLMFEMAPQMQLPFMQGTVNVVGLLLTMLREEWDRAAARRVDENRAMRSLFARAVGEVGEAALRRRLAEAGDGADTSLRIADLDATNDDLRQLLIDLQAHVEAQSGESARRLETEIWEELLASTERRRFAISPF